MAISVMLFVQMVVLVNVQNLMVIVLARKVTLGTSVSNAALVAAMDADNLMAYVIYVKQVTMAAHASTDAVTIVRVACVIRTLENATLVPDTFMEISAISDALQTVSMIFVYKALGLAVMDVT